MEIAIDGNIWCVSDGQCLGDPRSRFVFNRILCRAFDEYKNTYDPLATLPVSLEKFRGYTPEEYQTYMVKIDTTKPIFREEPDGS